MDLSRVLRLLFVVTFSLLGACEAASGAQSCDPICPESQECVSGVCVSPCSDATRRCQDGNVEVCLGQEFRLETECANGTECNSEFICALPVCTQGDKRCAGNAFETCDDGEWVVTRCEATEVCSSNFTCTAIGSSTFVTAIVNSDEIDDHSQGLVSSGELHFLGLSVQGADAEIVKAGSDGEILDGWNVRVENVQVAIERLILLSNNTLLVSGTIRNEDFSRDSLVLNMDFDGRVVWAKKLNVDVSHTVELSDSSILLTSKSKVGLRRLYSRMDMSGDILLSKEASWVFPVWHTLTTEDGVALAVSSGDVVHVDNSLAAIDWQRRYYTEIGFTLGRAANGDYIYASAQTAFPGHMTVFRTTAAGETLWSRTITTTGSDSLFGDAPFDIVGFHFVTEDLDGNIVAMADSEGGGGGSFAVVLTAGGEFVTSYTVLERYSTMHLLPEGQFLTTGFNTVSKDENIVFEKRNLATATSCNVEYAHESPESSARAMTPTPLQLSDTQEVVGSDISVVVTQAVRSQVAVSECPALQL